MKKLLFLLTAALVAATALAAPVDQATAMRKAKSYLANEMYAGRVMAPAALNPVLLKTELGNTKLGAPVYYIYNTSTTFLVISGDDRAKEVLMVGDQPLSLDRIPDGLQYLLDCYKEEIEFLQDRPNLQVDPEPRSQMFKAVTYGPLLTAKWDQESPYWNQCKFTYNNRSYQCLTGCPATSAAMVLYYWKYPTAAVPALPSYTNDLELSSYNVVSNYSYPALSSTTFDWANMKDTYASYSTDQANAVATLMRYVGQAEKMAYGTSSAGGSGILTNETQNIVDMFTKFGYDASTCRVAGKSVYSATNWANLIIGEMAAGRPVVYMGVSTSGGGHAFNVDGYRDSDGLYHVNFGWSGDGNSWYAMNAFSYGGYTFNTGQQAVVGIQPPGGVAPTPVLTVSPTSLSFSTYKGGTETKTINVSAENLQGAVTVAVSGSYYSVSTTSISAAEAMAGTTVTVTYNPLTSGTHSGTVTFTSSNAETQTVSLTGTSVVVPTLTATPSSLSFSTEAGTPVTQTFTLKGSNLTSTVYLNCTGTGFAVDKSNVTKTAANNGVTITVTYNPSAGGTHTGAVNITSNGAEAISVALTGTATGPNRTITATPSTLTFNAIAGETVTQTFNVSGTSLTGNLSLSLSNANGVYSITPTTITAAAAMAGNVPVTVTYAPTTFGTNNATVTISGGGAPSATVTLNGVANITKYAPVMLPANEQYIDLTQFRAEWTDATPDANVTSYTLEVTPKAVEPVEPVLLHSLSGSSYTGSYADITLPAPWGGVNTRGGNGAIYTKNNYNGVATGYITYTIPEGYNNAPFTLLIQSGSGTYGVGNFTVSSTQTAAVGHTFTGGETYRWLVTASSGEQITIYSTDADYSPDIALIAVYYGDATTTSLNASETGDENSRLITGITDKFYTVENLLAEGTFLYRVKALYLDGTESDWSNQEEVTLFQNVHGYPLGDVNHDGTVSINDVTTLVGALLANSTDSLCQICADANGDGNITIGDVTAITNILLNSNLRIARAIELGR